MNILGAPSVAELERIILGMVEARCAEVTAEVKSEVRKLRAS